jgi:predicted ABC-type sugar transport system permease subunit
VEPVLILMIVNRRNSYFVTLTRFTAFKGDAFLLKIGKKYFDENKVLMLIDGDDLIYRFEKR